MIESLSLSSSLSISDSDKYNDSVDQKYMDLRKQNIIRKIKNDEVKK